MKYTESDVEELIAAADQAANVMPICDVQGNLSKAVDKFRPKPKRVGMMSLIRSMGSIGVSTHEVKAVELDDEVRAALKAAGIEWDETT